MSTAKEIAALNDAMCVADVALENLDGGLQPTPYQRSLIALAAEVRRLREENERLWERCSSQVQNGGGE